MPARAAYDEPMVLPVAPLAFFSAAALAVANRKILREAAPHLHSFQSVPAQPLAIVLGAQVSPAGAPCALLLDRLTAAAQLHALGRTPALLVSGAPGEVEVMATFLEDSGVPRDDILLDFGGLRTLLSMTRARDRFSARRLLVVTNRFHLARAVWLARQCGIAAVGVAAPRRAARSQRAWLKAEAREVLARGRAVADVASGRHRATVTSGV